MAALEQLKRIRDIAINKMNEIIKMAEGVTEARASETETAAETATEEFVAEAEPVRAPEPVTTRVSHRAKGGVSKSQAIREYFSKHKEARNLEVIDYMKKVHNVEVKPSLVSTVKLSMKLQKGKPGRVKVRKAEGKVKVKARKGRRTGLPMVACIAKVMSKSKQGMSRDEVLEGVKRLGYRYSGAKGEEGLKNIVYQGLYALSQKKSHAGWKGSVPVLLHDEQSHTWKMNPKAEQKIA